MKEYWFCYIGPIEKHKVPHGGDLPLRFAVQNAFENMFDEVEGTTICSSGWGVSERQKHLLDIIRQQDEGTLELIVEAINTYKNR